MIIKKTYDKDVYVIMKVTNIKTIKNGKHTFLIGQLIDERGCYEFKNFQELILHVNNDIEVIEP